MSSKPYLRIKPGREKSILRRHPWIFSGAVAEVIGDPVPGDTVDILSSDGEWLGRAAYSHTSQIRARIWSWDADQEITPGFFRNKLYHAIGMRQALSSLSTTNGIRLVHAESDRLPGLIVDRYADWLVVQFLSCGSEFWRYAIIEALASLLPGTGIYERSDAEVRKLEGLPFRTGVLLGKEPPELITIEENGLKFRVDIHSGHKTGFYLDQRENRRRVRQIVLNKEVLDCFCYTGGFTLASLAGGAASVTAIDASPAALALSQQNLNLNGFSLQNTQLVQGDVFQLLRTYRDSRRSFDVIILDPPKFAATAAQAERAARGYKDINLLALKLLREGGWLVTFSCSGGIDEGLFQQIIASAAQDAGVDVQIVERLYQSPDHPVNTSYPEGAYLKGLVVYKRSASG